MNAVVRLSRRLVVVCALLASAVPAARAEDEHPDSAAIRNAIARAVRERVGRATRVSVTDLTVSPTIDRVAGPIVASPEPGARTGTAARFTLFANGSRVGSVVATARADARFVRARRALARGERIAAADVEEVEAALADEPMRRVPALADVIGARAKRNIVAGDAITMSIVELPPIVATGDTVIAVVRVGAVVAEGRVVASGSGRIGDVIRVLPAGTRRPLKARIVGPGRTEIIQ